MAKKIVPGSSEEIAGLREELAGYVASGNKKRADQVREQLKLRGAKEEAPKRGRGKGADEPENTKDDDKDTGATEPAENTSTGPAETR